MASGGDAVPQLISRPSLRLRRALRALGLSVKIGCAPTLGVTKGLERGLARRVEESPKSETKATRPRKLKPNEEK